MRIEMCFCAHFFKCKSFAQGCVNAKNSLKSEFKKPKRYINFKIKSCNSFIPCTYFCKQFAKNSIYFLQKVSATLGFEIEFVDIVLLHHIDYRGKAIKLKSTAFFPVCVLLATQYNLRDDRLPICPDTLLSATKSKRDDEKLEE